MIKPVFAILVSIIIGLSLQSCRTEPYEVHQITFVNKSAENIYVGYSSHGVVTPTVLFGQDSDVPFDWTKKIIYKDEATDSPSTTTGYAGGSEGNTKGEFHMIIYKFSTLEKYTPEELIEQDIYDKRYDLTLADLQAMHFFITYTGE